MTTNDQLRTVAPPTVVKPRRHLVDTRLGQMHVRTAGESGTPLLLVHTQVIGGRIFDWAIQLLATDRQVIVPDRIGFGDSDLYDEPLTMEDFAGATLDALDALGIEQVDVVGIHTGCKELITFLTEYPERVRKAVLITVAVYDESLAEMKAAVRAKFAKPPEPPARDGSHLLAAWNWWAGLLPEGIDLSVAQEWFTDHMKAGPNYWWLFVTSADDATAEKLPRITQPLLVMVPHDDGLPQAQAAMKYLPPQTEILDLPHVTNVMGVFTAHVDEIVGHIRRFLD